MIYTVQTIDTVVAELNKSRKSIVLSTGFFDLLHQEHIRFLKKARASGDVLIVAVESDERAREVKGSGRPVEKQAVRCTKVAGYCDYVIALGPEFNNQEAYDNLMATVRPHIYAVSSHTKHLDNKQELTEKYGGKLLVVHNWNPSISTTQILKAKNKV